MQISETNSASVRRRGIAKKDFSRGAAFSLRWITPFASLYLHAQRIVELMPSIGLKSEWRLTYAE
jgi:hypothetical protein